MCVVWWLLVVCCCFCYVFVVLRLSCVVCWFVSCLKRPVCVDLCVVVRCVRLLCCVGCYLLVIGCLSLLVNC